MALWLYCYIVHVTVGLIPCLDSLQRYFTGDFQALQLIVIAVFGALV